MPVKGRQIEQTFVMRLHRYLDLMCDLSIGATPNPQLFLDTPNTQYWGFEKPTSNYGFMQSEGRAFSELDLT